MSVPTAFGVFDGELAILISHFGWLGTLACMQQVVRIGGGERR